jgi:hypothetical protein
MQMLNRYFTPFALVLIMSAVWFNNLKEDAPGTMRLSLGILAADLLVNWLIGRNQYRWLAWSRQLRVLQVWLNYLWAVPLFYMLYPYWAPMWLLFVMAPVAAALTLGRVATIACALASAATMLGAYWMRQPLEGVFLGMALSHAAFIVMFALFVHGLAQTALRLRDAAQG